VYPRHLKKNYNYKGIQLCLSQPPKSTQQKNSVVPFVKEFSAVPEINEEKTAEVTQTGYRE
jgi:hypothetical protein